LKNLRTLLLSQNNLNRIPGDTFKHNPEIQMLSLQFNNLNAVGRSFLDNLPNLRYLEIRHNICINRDIFVQQIGVDAARAELENCFVNYETF
jgi:hypothetical protein